MSNLVSIMIPVYNAERYLERCLNSVISLTYANIEVILVNDGSTDCTGAICDRYAELDHRIKIFHKTNEGVAATRNFALSKATGEYLMFVDSDDRICPDAVSFMYERMIYDGSDMVIGRYLICDESSGKMEQCGTKLMDEVISGEYLLENFGIDDFAPCAPWGKLYKRELFNGLQYPSLSVGEDEWVYPQILERCNLISCISENVYFYYIVPDGLTHSKTERAWFDALRADANISRLLLDRGYIRSSRHCFDGAVRNGLRMNNHRAALEMLKGVFSRDELHLLMRGRGFAPYLRWLCFYFPGMYQAIRGIKKYLRYG